MACSTTVQPALPHQCIQPVPIENRRSSSAIIRETHTKPETAGFGVFLLGAQKLATKLKGCVVWTTVNDAETLWTIHEVLVGYHFVFALVSVILKMLGAALLTVAALLIGATSAASRNLKLVTLTVLSEVFLVITFIVAMSCRWSAFGTWESDGDGKLTAESSAALSLGVVQTISAVIWCVAGTLILRRNAEEASMNTRSCGDNGHREDAIFTKHYACSAFHSKSTDVPTDLESLQGGSTVSLTEGRHQSNYSAQAPTLLFSMPAQPASSSEQHMTVSSERLLTCFYPQPRMLQPVCPPIPSVVYAVTPDGILCPPNTSTAGRYQCDDFSAVSGVGAGVTRQSSASEAGDAKRVFSSNAVQPRLRKNSSSMRQQNPWSPEWPASAPVSPRFASEL